MQAGARCKLNKEVCRLASVLPGHSTAVRPGTRRQHPATVPWGQCQMTQERERCAQILKVRRKTSDRVRLEIKDRKEGGRRGEGS